MPINKFYNLIEIKHRATWCFFYLQLKDNYLSHLKNQMRKTITAIVYFIVTTISCNNPAAIKKNDPIESGTGFIQASLNGNYDNAKEYLLPDTTNIEYLNVLKDFNSKRSEEDRKGYKEANILIDSTQKISDSVVIITYSNTYKNKPSKLKMVKKNNEWLVDFKYTFIDSL